MIPVETRYETNNGELLAIVEAFKTWRHYLEGSQHQVFVLTDHNNLRRFMDTKSLSFRQVRWAQKLSRYHFRIDYRQGKANGAADALSRYPQRSAAYWRHPGMGVICRSKSFEAPLMRKKSPDPGKLRL